MVLSENEDTTFFCVIIILSPHQAFPHNIIYKVCLSILIILVSFADKYLWKCFFTFSLPHRWTLSHVALLPPGYSWLPEYHDTLVPWEHWTVASYMMTFLFLMWQVALQTNFQAGLSVIFLCKDSAGVIRQVPVSGSLLPHKIPTRFPLFLFLTARAMPKQKVVFQNFACNSLAFSFLLPASSILHVKFIY